MDGGAGLFAAIGCRRISAGTFHPALHEVVAVEQAADPAAPIEVVGQVWPALMLGELVFTRAGVRVRAGAQHAVAGIADRSTLHWEFRRRHRATHDESFGWGHNSQWRTRLRRDYVTEQGCVYHLDAFAPRQQELSRWLAEDETSRLDDATRASFVRNRCMLTVDLEPEDHLLHQGIDERTG